MAELWEMQTKLTAKDEKEEFERAKAQSWQGKCINSRVRWSKSDESTMLK
jgi:hypothetical protein